MVEAGAFDDGPRVELLDGELVEMSPPGVEHEGLTTLISHLLGTELGEGWVVRQHSSLVLGDHDRPQPDIAVVRGVTRDYLLRQPTGEDAALVVEIANSSHTRDRRKAQLYAKWGVPEYWIVDIPGRQIVVHRRPAAEGYEDVATYGEDDEVTVPVAGVAWPVAKLLPPRRV